MEEILLKSSESPKITCLIVDDEENAIDGIVDYLNELESFIVVDTCFSAIEAMEVLKQKAIDLMFLDINMPHLTGLEFLELLPNPPIVILTTAYSEYALDAFRLNVADYLLKPYSFQRFFQATQKAADLLTSQRHSAKHETERPSDMYIRQEGMFQKINCDDILFIEAMQNYMKLFLADKTFVIHQTMSIIEEILPKDAFFRIHNSYLVNVNHIDAVEKGRLVVKGKTLPISKYRREAFMNSVVYKNLISK